MKKAVEGGISRHVVIPLDCEFPVHLKHGFSYGVALGDTEVTIEVRGPVISDSWEGIVRLVELGHLKITADLDVFRAWALMQG